MTGVVGRYPIGAIPAADEMILDPVEVIDEGNGFVSLSFRDGTGTRSVDPTGIVTKHLPPSDQHGAYEKCAINGNAVVYCPDASKGYAFVFFAKVPNV